MNIRIQDIAQNIIDAYKLKAKEDIKQDKLHYLAYLVIRAAIYHGISFDSLEDIEIIAKSYGPLFPQIKTYFDETMGMDCKIVPSSDDLRIIINDVILEYAEIATWKLRKICKDELSYKVAISNENSDNPSKRIKFSDIKKDSEKIREFDTTWGMYVDEFDDWSNSGYTGIINKLEEKRQDR